MLENVHYIVKQDMVVIAHPNTYLPLSGYMVFGDTLLVTEHRLRVAQQDGKEAVPVMKRGLISWDRAELPAAAFDARLSALYQLCADFDVPALVAYSDVCRSNDVRYISNYMPYWNRALDGRAAR